MTNEQLQSLRSVPELTRRLDAALAGLSPLQAVELLGSVNLEGTDLPSLTRAVESVERGSRQLQKPKSGVGSLILGFGAILTAMAIASAIGGGKRD